jgi:hypothetical protein
MCVILHTVLVEVYPKEMGSSTIFILEGSSPGTKDTTFDNGISLTNV